MRVMKIHGIFPIANHALRDCILDKSSGSHAGKVKFVLARRERQRHVFKAQQKGGSSPPMTIHDEKSMVDVERSNGLLFVESRFGNCVSKLLDLSAIELAYAACRHQVLRA